MLNTENLTYSIGQVEEITDVPQSTLRYWENVIHSLNPHKTAGGSRRYSKADIEQILIVKDLLYEKKYTIKGANLYLDHNSSIEDKVEANETLKEEKKETSSNSESKILLYISRELKTIKNILDS